MNAVIQPSEDDCTRSAADYCDVNVLLPRDFVLESGERLSRPEFCVRVLGDPARPAIVVSGGISSGRVVADDGETKGWWRDFVYPGGAVDLDRFCVIAFDFIPNAGEIARTITTLDQARALAFALDALNIDKLFGFVGASYGGMVALAFAAAFPERLDRLTVICAAHHTHPAATAFRGVQRRIIDFADRCGRAQEGVALARQLAMITYRTPEEFAQRFDSRPGDAAGDPYAVCDYLIARGGAYGMAAEKYLTLSDSLDRHSVDPSNLAVESLFIAARSDRLVPVEDMRRLAEAAPSSRLVEIDSLYGHDAFLKETAAIGPVLKHFLEERL